MATALIPSGLWAQQAHVGAEPLEKLSGVSVSYERIDSGAGYMLRGVVTKPVEREGRQPGLFLVGWLSCDAIEGPVGGPDTFIRLLQRIARDSGLIFLRVEKPGIGGSEGPPCSENDLQADLGAYRAGLRALASRADVDPARIYLLGLSNGGGIAPLVAGGFPVAGYVVSGGWAKTWLEHMLELERRRLELSGRAPGEVSEALRGFADFYSLYLNGHLTPAEIETRRPDLKGLWYDEPAHQYGRPARFFHQLQSLNLAAAWQQVKVPVLAIHGGHDWIMSEADHRMIVDVVNRNRPGLARFVSVPKMDHFYRLHLTQAESFRDEPGAFAESLPGLIVDWLRERAAELKGAPQS